MPGKRQVPAQALAPGRTEWIDMSLKSAPRVRAAFGPDLPSVRLAEVDLFLISKQKQ